MLIHYVIEGGLAAALGIAFYKHGTLSAVIASAKKEVANIEAALPSVEATAKADIAKAVAALKALL
jgi:hypothetical protein